MAIFDPADVSYVIPIESTAGAGPGGSPGRGTGVDLTAGTGRGRLCSCAEKAAGFIDPLRVNIVSNIILLVFIFLIAQAPCEEFRVAAATELSSPEQLALDCSKGDALLCQPLLVSCHLLIRKSQERVLGNVKFSDYPTIRQMDSPRTGWNSGSNRDSQLIYRHGRPGSPIPATGSSAKLDNE
jgi:hypothetical protein